MSVDARQVEGRDIEVIVNGERMTVGARTLGELLDDLGYGEARVATALDGVFVSARSRQETSLRPGMRIEIVAPRQGG